MRKAVAFLFLLVLCFMAGCTAEKSDSQNLVIENVDWKISTVQSVEKEGTIIACGKEEAKEAEAVDITCTAETGKMLIHDHTHNKSYTFAYKLENANSAASIYKVLGENQEGNAVVSMTSHDNSDPVLTLVLQLGNYALYFSESISK